MRMALRNIRRMLIHRSRPCLFSNQREENEKFITLTSSRTELSVLAIFHTCDADRRLSITQNVSVLHSVVLSAPFVCWCTGNFHARITGTVTDLIRVMSFWLTGRLKCTWGEKLTASLVYLIVVPCGRNVRDDFVWKPVGNTQLVKSIL